MPSRNRGGTGGRKAPAPPSGRVAREAGSRLPGHLQCRSLVVSGLGPASTRPRGTSPGVRRSPVRRRTSPRFLVVSGGAAPPFLFRSRGPDGNLLTIKPFAEG